MARIFFLTGFHYRHQLLVVRLHLDFHFCLSGQCPGLVDIHPGDESAVKDIRLLIVGSYFSFLDWRMSWHPTRRLENISVSLPFLAWLSGVPTFVLSL
jgi:hypothetical protein